MKIKLKKNMKRKLIRTRTNTIDGVILGEVGESVIIVGIKQEPDVVRASKTSIKVIEEADIDKEMYGIYNHEILKKYLDIECRIALEDLYILDLDTLCEIIENISLPKNLKNAFSGTPVEEFTCKIGNDIYIKTTYGFFLKFKLKS